MISLFASLPGHIWTLVAAYPLLCIVGAAIIATGLYICALKLFFALEGAREERDRRRR